MVEYIIVKCGACDTAQVVQKPRQFSSTTGKKRTVRWACKLCGEAKQSIVKIYASSELPNDSPCTWDIPEQHGDSVAASRDWRDSPAVGTAGSKRGRASSWERYMAPAEDTAESRDSSHMATPPSRAHVTSSSLLGAPASPALPSEAEVLAMFD